MTIGAALAGLTGAAVRAEAIELPPGFSLVIAGPSIAGDLGDGGWYTSDVLFGWSITDFGGTGYTSEGCDGYDLVDFDTFDYSRICTVTPTGGEPTEYTWSVARDATGPAITIAPSASPNANGWYHSEVTFSVSGTDDFSGVTGCSDDLVHGDADGDGADLSATLDCFDLAGNVTYESVTFSYDATPPTISASLSGNLVGDVYYGDVVVTYSCADATSGIDTCPGPQTLSGTGDLPYLGTAVDFAGNSATVSGTVAVVGDTTPPTVTPSVSPAADGTTGWWNATTGAPSVAYTCTDLESGILTCTEGPFTFGEGAGQAHTGTATDVAGNTGSATVTVDVDLTAPAVTPTLTGSLASGPAPSGWWNASTGAPTVSFSCSDATSGVALCPSPSTFGEGAGQSHTGTATDVAGNTGSATVTVDVDLTAPSLTVSGGPADGTSYLFGTVPAAPTCTAVDGLSGSTGCSVSGYSSAVGSHTVTMNAGDAAGNTVTETRTYHVTPWTLVGFAKPIDTSGAFNSVRSGAGVTLKFEIFAGATELTAPSSVAGVTTTQVTCAATPSVIGPVSTPIGSVIFKAGGFQVDWKAPSAKGTCYRVTVSSADGSTLSAFFRTK